MLQDNNTVFISSSSVPSREKRPNFIWGKTVFYTAKRPILQPTGFVAASVESNRHKRAKNGFQNDKWRAVSMGQRQWQRYTVLPLGDIRGITGQSGVQLATSMHTKHITVAETGGHCVPQFQLGWHWPLPYLQRRLLATLTMTHTK